MSAILDEYGSEGGVAAQTGNLVHEAAAAFHREVGSIDTKTEAGRAELEAARAKFPLGNPETAHAHFARYAADKRNQTEEVTHVETQVRLTLDPAPTDPTGEPIVIQGTLDQIRRVNGVYTLWDIKTGSGVEGAKNLLAYMVQQCAYLLAGRQHLGIDLRPGGIIWTPAYEKKFGIPFLEYKHDVDAATLLVGTLPYTVAEIRRGIPLFRPSDVACKYCPAGAGASPGRSAEQCTGIYHARFGRKDRDE